MSWRPPNDPTGPARELWAALFPGQPWPARWRVRWVGFMRGAAGLTLYKERRILLSYGDHVRRHLPRPDPVETLLHEFVHVRCGRQLRHGQEFRWLENNLRARLGLRLLDERVRQQASVSSDSPTVGASESGGGAGGGCPQATDTRGAFAERSVDASRRRGES